MAILAWIICIGSFLGGFAAQTDLPHGLSATISTGLFWASLLSCPALWKLYPLSDMLNDKQRMMACLALLLALPLVLMPA
tara:strand:+ start:241 stop:480 length:240 start_codon:yes stop_codon:yes gene_type:complete